MCEIPVNWPVINYFQLALGSGHFQANELLTSGPGRTMTCLHTTRPESSTLNNGKHPQCFRIML